jgi:ABC-type glycerol-3-phosphate transport system permease component
MVNADGHSGETDCGYAVAQSVRRVGIGVIAAAGVLMIVPGAILIFFVRNYLAKGFALGRV